MRAMGAAFGDGIKGLAKAAYNRLGENEQQRLRNLLITVPIVAGAVMLAKALGTKGTVAAGGAAMSGIAAMSMSTIPFLAPVAAIAAVALIAVAVYQIPSVKRVVNKGWEAVHETARRFSAAGKILTQGVQKDLADARTQKLNRVSRTTQPA